MSTRKIQYFFPLVLLLAGCQQDEWIPLFDGQTLDGWEANENKESWKIEDGAIVTSGPRSHLFYMGDVLNHNFRNFEFMAEVKTEPASNSGIYFHTQIQEEGWPEKGYECQVINSKPDVETGQVAENKMTGSIYAIRNVWKSPVPDHEWFQYRIVVQGKTICTYINGELIADYTEPDKPYRIESFKGRLLSSGTFALQCHDPGSRVSFRNIRVKPLPDDLATPGSPPDDLEFEKQIIELAGANIPLADLHVHLKGGLTMEDALANARRYGFSYGFAVNCGKEMTLETNEEVRKYLDNYRQPSQTWHAMQAEGREWMKLFSPEVVSRFDYVFTDAMTWTNDQGRRMRLWIPEEVEVGDPQVFMDQLVERIVGIVENEPIDIYVNPTYLPDTINAMYDELWTEERMNRVIRALAEKQVALEINNRRMIPSPAFIKRAKKAGVKFTFGTNNAGADDLGRMEYAIRMIKECDLKPGDIWLPDKN
jgi:hypothetical protein